MDKFTKNMVERGELVLSSGTAIELVTVSGWYECTDGYHRRFVRDRGSLRGGTRGYSPKLLTAMRSVEEEVGLLGPDNEKEFYKRLSKIMG